MKTRLTTLITASMFSGAAIAASGGGAEAHHVPSWGEVIGPLAIRYGNLALFIFLLWFFLRKPMASFLQNRRKDIEDNINQSAERKAWAEQMYADYNRRLDGIDQEIVDLKTSLKKEGEAESQKILAHADKVAHDIKKDASMIAEAELDDLKIQLRNDAIDTAAMVAKETVLRNINKDDHERINQEFLGELQKTKGASS